MTFITDFFFQGIKNKLDYIKNEAKAQAISVSFLQTEGKSSPIYSATNANLTSITSELGNMEKFSSLVKAVHKSGNYLCVCY